MSRLRNVPTILLCALFAACDGSQDADSSEPNQPPAAAAASSSRWQADRDFVVLTASPTETPSEDVVTEIFWYGCPHCYTFEPHLTLWLRKNKPSHVKFIRMPIAWSVRDRQHARLFYTLEALSLDDLHHEVFDTIHRQGNALCDRESDERAFSLQLAFASSFGVNEAQFTQVYYSAEVNSKMAEAERLTKIYKIEALPSIVVNGKYRSDLVLTHGRASDLIELTDHLITTR